ncbi:MAG TPA: integrase, partial [Chloroflexota bacterium]|nr:integrase [Chloroflexota bacterium]
MRRRASKAPYGGGTVYLRKDGMWVASVRLASGERKVFYAKTEAEAKRNLKEVRGYLEDGLPL